MQPRPHSLLLRPAALAGLVALSGAFAHGEPAVPAPPVDWKPGSEARVFAGGSAYLTRDFVWGQKLEPATGVLRLAAVDHTWTAGAAAPDSLKECVARVKVPARDVEFYVRFTALQPRGEQRPTFGGVVVGQDLFGNTNVGGPGMFPRLRAHVAVWGYANVVKNGKVIGRDRTALAWAGQGARDARGKWLFKADDRRASAHLVVFGALGHGTALAHTEDGFLHFSWPLARVISPGYTFDPQAAPAGLSLARE